MKVQTYLQDSKKSVNRHTLTRCEIDYIIENLRTKHDIGFELCVKKMSATYMRLMDCKRGERNIMPGSRLSRRLVVQQEQRECVSVSRKALHEHTSREYMKAEVARTARR